MSTKNIPLKSIVSDPNQPRKSFNENELIELSNSIKEYGVLQPILVRPIKPKGYMIIAGERRFRASQLANRQNIPCIVKKDYSDKDILEMQIIENLQRVDVEPLEESEAFSKLISEGYKHEDIAIKLGKGIDFVYKRIKLGQLSDDFKGLLKDEKITLSTAMNISGYDIEEQNILFNSLDKDFSNWELTQLIAKQDNNLKKANFDIEKKGMVSNPISCLDCPFNSNNSFGLFEDENPTCKKVICFNAKSKEVFLNEFNTLTDSNCIIGIEEYSLNYLSDSKQYNYDFLSGLTDLIPNKGNYEFYSEPLKPISKEEFLKSYGEDFLEDGEEDYKNNVESYHEDLEKFNLISKDDKALKIRVVSLSTLKINESNYFAIEKESSINKEEKLKEQSALTETELSIQKINSREKRKKEIESTKCFKDVIQLTDNKKYTHIEAPLSKVEIATFIFGAMYQIDYDSKNQIEKDYLEKESGYDTKIEISNFDKLMTEDIDKLFHIMIRLFNRSNIRVNDNDENTNVINHGYFKALKENFENDIQVVDSQYKDREKTRLIKINERLEKLK